MVKKRRPPLFEDPQGTMGRMAEAMRNDMYRDVAKGINPDEAEIKRMPKYLQVTEKRMRNMGVIDLKPYFRKSPHAEQKDDGGWFMRVPIRRRKSSMSSRNYEELRQQDITPQTEKKVYSKYLFDRRQVSEAQNLNYVPRSNMITKRREVENQQKKHTYTAWRTVSDKSPANSWIVNRQKISESNSSKTMVKNVDRLMKWKMKNM